MTFYMNLYLTIQQYIFSLLFIMLYKVILTFESVDEILWCDHTYENDWAVLAFVTVSYTVKSGYNYCVCGRTP